MSVVGAGGLPALIPANLAPEAAIDLAGRMDELGEKNGEIVVYCQSGGRSAMAKRLLESNGFTKVHDLGGIGHW